MSPMDLETNPWSTPVSHENPEIYLGLFFFLSSLKNEDVTFLISVLWTEETLFHLFVFVFFLMAYQLFLGYLMPKPLLREEQQWYYLTHSWEDKGVHTFPKGICPKVNVVARLEYELAYYDSAVHRFNHYPTRTPLFHLSPRH